MLNLDNTLKDRKTDILSYFRERSAESLEMIRKTYGSDQYKERASAVNKAIIETRNDFVKTLVQKAHWDRWEKQDILKCILLINYVSYMW